MTNPDMKAQKAALREQFTQARNAAYALAPDPLGGARVNHILDQALALTKSPKAVSAYWPFRSEIDTRSLMTGVEARGLDLCLPVVHEHAQPLHFRPYHSGDRLLEDQFGVLVPAHTGRELIPELLFVPLLAFDRGGHRLGYGGGYYDRTLAAYRAVGDCTAIGLAYEAQLSNASLAFEPTDLALDAVFTEQAFWLREGKTLVRNAWAA